MSVNSIDSTSQTSFLTVPELAELLHINEKKVYQLAGVGDIPGTKITGKWIFPRQMIEDWIAENSHGGVMSDRLIIVGSDDRLLNQLCNHTAIDIQHSALLSYCPCGTRHGLRMLDSHRADACFINWGATEDNARRHQGLLRGYKNHNSWVIVRCLQRTQGLIVSEATYRRSTNAMELISDTSLAWALPNEDSGAQRLLADACAMSDQRYENLAASTQCNTERSAVASVSTGLADLTCGAASTAHEYNLRFIPLAEVSLDLVTTRRTYFRTLLQELLKRLVDEDAQALAQSYKGYTLQNKLDVMPLAS